MCQYGHVGLCVRMSVWACKCVQVCQYGRVGVCRPVNMGGYKLCVCVVVSVCVGVCVGVYRCV